MDREAAASASSLAVRGESPSAATFAAAAATIWVCSIIAAEMMMRNQTTGIAVVNFTKVKIGYIHMLHTCKFNSLAAKSTKVPNIFRFMIGSDSSRLPISTSNIKKLFIAKKALLFILSDTETQALEQIKIMTQHTAVAPLPSQDPPPTPAIQHSGL
jgi:hypothetical protein